MLTVYGYPQTRSSRITWMLEELGQDYTYELIDFMKGQHKSAEYLAINPGGKVPAFKDDELLLTESAAIVTYLGDKFGRHDLVPAAGSTDRARYEQWAYFALCELEQGLWNMSKHRFALPSDKRVKELLPTASWEFQQALELLSQGLGDNDYILGDSFSAADILLGHSLFWGLSFKQPIEQKNLQTYIDRLRARPAVSQYQAREQASLNA
ncbi:glutathione S-transferase family protein [Maricurvus nonylphenolicus]|uniref:glutathione S-transferase family protein n=1 Tax=Maricurvus nonylphenolicus TaxID=1008307 RepID=UPI0036F2B688